VVSAVAFATILAVFAGVTLAASASIAHDLHAALRRRPAGRGARREVAVARLAAVAIGAAAIGVALLARNLNVAFLVGASRRAR
jgi:cation/acetate symporter